MTVRTALRLIPLLARISASLMPLLLASCSTVQDDLHSGPPAPQTVPKLAQLQFGPQAAYGLCAEPNCPVVTRKTIATTATLQMGPGVTPPPPIVGANPPVRAPIPPARSVAVYFRVGDSHLSESAKATLNSALTGAAQVKRIAIFGRTDNTGSETLNGNLADARAESVANYIRAKHPEFADALKQSYQGTCCYVASNDTAEGRRLNRRVEVLITTEAPRLP